MASYNPQKKKWVVFHPHTANSQGELVNRPRGSAPSVGARRGAAGRDAERAGHRAADPRGVADRHLGQRKTRLGRGNM